MAVEIIEPGLDYLFFRTYSSSARHIRIKLETWGDIEGRFLFLVSYTLEALTSLRVPLLVWLWLHL